MEQSFALISEVGVPIAGALVMAYFIFLVMKQLMDGLVDEIKTVQGITKMLITRASIMNNDPNTCLLYTSPSPRDGLLSRMPSSA